MKKSYQVPISHIVRMRYRTQLLQSSATTQGKFSDNGPSGGWDAGGASSRRGGWDGNEE